MSAMLNPPEVATPDCLSALRAGTRAHHERIEQALDMARLREPEHHRRVMQALLDFHAGWEVPMLSAHPRDDRLFLTLGSRWPMLVQDARALKLRVPMAAGHASCRTWLSRADQAWGSAYVVWGSMLGGRVICKQMNVQREGAEMGHDGWQYFVGHGPWTGQLWKEFLERLQARAQAPGFCVDACVQAARQTFEALEAAFLRTPA